jgi:hypothetical protein
MAQAIMETAAVLAAAPAEPVTSVHHHNGVRIWAVMPDQVRTTLKSVPKRKMTIHPLLAQAPSTARLARHAYLRALTPARHFAGANALS